MAKYCINDKLYDISDLKSGAVVKFNSLPISSIRKLKLIGDEEFTIKSVLAKVDELGKIQVVIELNEIPNSYFNYSVLSVSRFNK